MINISFAIPRSLASLVHEPKQGKNEEETAIKALMQNGFSREEAIAVINALVKIHFGEFDTEGEKRFLRNMPDFLKVLKRPALFRSTFPNGVHDENLINSFIDFLIAFGAIKKGSKDLKDCLGCLTMDNNIPQEISLVAGYLLDRKTSSNFELIRPVKINGKIYLQIEASYMRKGISLPGNNVLEEGAVLYREGDWFFTPPVNNQRDIRTLPTISGVRIRSLALAVSAPKPGKSLGHELLANQPMIPIYFDGLPKNAPEYISLSPTTKEVAFSLSQGTYLVFEIGNPFIKNFRGAEITVHYTLFQKDGNLALNPTLLPSFHITTPDRKPVSSLSINPPSLSTGELLRIQIEDEFSRIFVEYGTGKTGFYAEENLALNEQNTIPLEIRLQNESFVINEFGEFIVFNGGEEKRRGFPYNSNYNLDFTLPVSLEKIRSPYDHLSRSIFDNKKVAVFYERAPMTRGQTLAHLAHAYLLLPPILQRQIKVIRFSYKEGQRNKSATYSLPNTREIRINEGFFFPSLSYLSEKFEAFRKEWEEGVPSYVKSEAQTLGLGFCGRLELMPFGNMPKGYSGTKSSGEKGAPFIVTTRPASGLVTREPIDVVNLYAEAAYILASREPNRFSGWERTDKKITIAEDVKNFLLGIIRLEFVYSKKPSQATFIKNLTILKSNGIITETQEIRAKALMKK